MFCTAARFDFLILCFDFHGSPHPRIWPPRLHQTVVVDLWLSGCYKTNTLWETVIYLFKGIVHPKILILSSFTHPQVVPNLYEYLCSAEHKERYSEECGKQKFWGTIDFYSIFFLLWKSMVPQNSLVTNFLQNIFLCVRQNKDIHTGLELLEGE